MKFIEAIREAVAFRDISPELMEAAMEILFRGEAHDAQIGALAVALQMKGETAEELAAAVRVMRRHATRVELVASPLLDTCGTGGDGLSTFNISTVSALVLASLDVPIAKHGNRAVSSTTGSADLLEELGVKIDLEAESARRCFEEAGIVFSSRRVITARYGTLRRRGGPLACGASSIFLVHSRILPRSRIKSSASMSHIGSGSSPKSSRCWGLRELGSFMERAALMRSHPWA